MDFLDNTCKKRSNTEKKEYCHRILHIHISLGFKFQFQLTNNFDFLKQICPKKGVSFKQKKT